MSLLLLLGSLLEPEIAILFDEAFESATMTNASGARFEPTWSPFGLKVSKDRAAGFSHMAGRT